MTSIVCWASRDWFFEGVWSISDSRVTGNGGVLTDNCPKLFSIEANVVQSGDLFNEQPQRILSLGFGFAGGTLLGMNVKEMLSTILARLSPVSYYDEPNYPFSKRIPTIEEIARLAARLAQRYVLSIGALVPLGARTEMVLFGYCVQTGRNRLFKISTAPASPTEVAVEECSLDEQSYVVIGDQPGEIRALIDEVRERFDVRSANWRRAPIIVMANLLRSGEINSIGGYMQLCVVMEREAKFLRMPLANDFSFPMVGFKLYEDIGQIGGFMVDRPFGLTAPGENGWDAQDI
jgi:hypothetical protein